MGRDIGNSQRNRKRKAALLPLFRFASTPDSATISLSMRGRNHQAPLPSENTALAARLDRWAARAFAGNAIEFQEARKATLDRIIEEIAFARVCRGSASLSVAEFEDHCRRFDLAYLVAPEPPAGAVGGRALAWPAIARTLSGKVKIAPNTALRRPEPAFDDYLRARRLKRAISKIQREINAYSSKRWSYPRALEYWVTIAGSIPPHARLKYFLQGELQWSDTLDPRVSAYLVSQWQLVIRQLLPPLLGNRQLRKSLTRHAGSTKALFFSDINLLLFHHACAQITGDVQPIDWTGPRSFADWLSSARQHIDVSVYALLLESLSRLGLDCQNLAKCSLKTSDLMQASLRSVNFSEADLRSSRFCDADLERANFVQANLVGADFSEANLHSANFSHADCRNANFEDANLTGARLNDVDLRGANLREAGLAGVSVRGADLRHAALDAPFRTIAKKQGAIL